MTETGTVGDGLVLASVEMTVAVIVALVVMETGVVALVVMVTGVVALVVMVTGVVALVVMATGVVASVGIVMTTVVLAEMVTEEIDTSPQGTEVMTGQIAIDVFTIKPVMREHLSGDDVNTKCNSKNIQPISSNLFYMWIDTP